jgi:putative acetyltransferase
VDISREDLDSPQALTLIDALDEELSARYPEPEASFCELALEETMSTNGAFLVGYLDGRPVACGAVRRIADDAAEIVRMYVRPDVRRRGLARAVLGELERIARELGARRLVLTTGRRQPEALSLYRGAGFAQLDRAEALSSLDICLAKDLQ